MHQFHVLGVRLKVPHDACGQGRGVHVLDVLERLHNHIVMLRPRGGDAEPAIAGDDGGDPMVRRRPQGRIPEDLRVVMRVNVDKSRSHHAAGGIQLVPGAEVRPDLLHNPLADGDVGDTTGIAAAVEHHPAAVREFS